MKTITLDGPTVDRLIDAAVQDRGEDFVYKDAYEGLDCVYFITESYAKECKSAYEIDVPAGPACLVGKIFHDLDPALDDILLNGNTDAVAGLFGVYFPSSFDDENPDLDEIPAISEAHGRDVELVVDALALAKLMVAQRTQDYGNPWGVARDRAKAVGV